MKRSLSPLVSVAFVIAILMLPSCSNVRSVDGYRFDRKGKKSTGHAEGQIAGEVEYIQVDNRFGQVRIEVADGESSWSWDLTCWANTTELADWFREEIVLEMDEMDNRHSWTVLLPEPPIPELRGVESNLTLLVSPSVQVDVANGFGDTQICGVQGGTTARCKHGKLQLTDLGAEIDAETSYAALDAERIPGGRLANRHGRIHATDVQGDLQVESSYDEVVAERVSGELKVRNSHGDVHAQGITGRAEIRTSYDDIELEEIGGDLLLRNQHGDVTGSNLHGKIDVETQYGGIDLDAGCPELVCKNHHGRVKLTLTSPDLRLVNAKTSYADLELNVPASLSPRIEARADRGKIKSELPVLVGGTGSDVDQSIPRITLENRNGNIKIKRAAKSDAGGDAEPVLLQYID